ncbi:MAG: cupin-like domain-containing protein [Flavobacteriaceae bacterium]|nr:cupin-like domain-containing protein [Flavobacteriaceae bacterium]
MNELLTKEDVISTFHDLINPMTIQDFNDNHWDKKVLLIRREDSSYYNSLLTISQIDEVLDLHRPKGSSLRVVKNQEPLNATKYENKDGSLNLNQLYAAYGDGYTIVINEIDRFWKPIKTLCQNARQLLSHKTKGNMYLTPKNQKALFPHYDAHDVFVLQVAGKKHWKIYDDQYKTPLVNSFQPIFQREQLQNVKEITLNAGDMMYIPRGIPHEAYTTDESSLHLTIGVYPTQWLDFISKTLQNLAQTNLPLRQALPIGYLSNDNTFNNISDKITNITPTICKELSTGNSITGALHFLAEEFRTSGQPKGDGHFDNLDKMNDVNLDTYLIKRDNMTCKVQQLDTIARIIYPGNVIRGPIGIAPSLEFISENHTGFYVHEIPILNDANKIKLSKRLIRGGLLKLINKE